jgi:ribosomal protein S13
MIYLFESELPENKSVYFVLTHIYGIGVNYFNLQKVGFSANLKVKIYLKIKLLNL